jgi:hypothetical protein
MPCTLCPRSGEPGSAICKIKIPQQAAGVIRSAEKEGFEPPDPWLQINGFQDRRIRPLCHFSAAKIIFFCFLSLFLNKYHILLYICIL